MKIKMPVQAQKIIKRLEEAGHEAYIVGGCVRDSILGKHPADWDITTSASPVEIKELFSYTIDTGIEHGTVTVMADHQPFEVTTYRVDGKYEDHRRPKKVQLGFQIEEETKAAIRRQARFLKDISAERIRVELDKLLVSDHPEVLADAYKLGVTEVILPEFDTMMETPQNNPHHKYNVGMHTIEALKHIEPDSILRWTMLLHDAGKPEARVEGKDKDHFKMHPVIGEKIAEKIIRRLKFDNQTLKQVKTLVLWHDRRFASPEEASLKTVRRWVSQIGPEMFEKLMKIQAADIAAQSEYHREEKEAVLARTKELFRQVLEAQDCLSVRDLAVGGTDLIEAGVPQGREVGQMLSWLLDQVLETPELNKKEILMRLVKEKREREQ